MPNKYRPTLISLVLVVITLALYWPAGGFDFINYDDTEYVVFNPAIQKGVTREGVAWAFSSRYASNWHPLTWISHMMDCGWYGLRAGRHHLTNIFLHAENVALLFFVLLQMTGALWRSALVAALFGWHPLHVESVAWISERKDVLSTLFWLFTLIAYWKYAETSKVRSSSSKWFYFLTLLCFALGLLSKPMVITLPFVLLLLDFWPLNRFSESRDPAGDSPIHKSNAARLLLEKLPFFTLAAVDGLLTIWAQRGSNSVVSAATLPVSKRLANALVSYVLYLWKTVWPTNLAIPYPYSHTATFWAAAGAALLLLVISALVIFQARARPCLAVGWFWFLGTLLPVIGLVQVGSQSMADRYTYVPLIGIFIMVAWSIPAKWALWPRPGFIFGAITAGVLLNFLIMTETQLQYWRNSASLFSHTVAVTRENILAEYNLAVGLAQQGRDDEAIVHYQRALAIHPNPVEAQYNAQPEAHFNLGLIFRQQARWPEAEAQFRACIGHNPNLVQAHTALGQVLLPENRGDEALAEFKTVTSLEPHDVAAQRNLGAAFAQLGKIPDAVAQYRQALWMKPDDVESLNALAWLLATSQRAEARNGPEAVGLAKRACELTGDHNARFLATLDAAYAETGRFEDAINAAQKTRRTALAQGREDLATAADGRMELYRAQKSYRE